MQIEVKYKLVIEPGKEFEITEKQAKDLLKQLQSIFNQDIIPDNYLESLKNIKKDIPEPIYNPPPLWYYPMKKPLWDPPSWTITCKSTNLGQ